jgi:DDE superfamily endonuclease
MLGVVTTSAAARGTAVPFTLSCAGGPAQSAGLLAGFRGEFYRCLTRRGDALFGLADAVLCEGRRVTDLARLSLVPEFGRGHGALYDGLNAGRADIGRLRRAVAGLPLPAWPDGRIRLAADVTAWLRPDAATSPERLFCHVQGKGRNAGQQVAGWPYSFVAALGPGASSWTLLLDAVRIGPDDNETELAAAQLRRPGHLGTGSGHRGRGVAPVRAAGGDRLAPGAPAADQPVRRVGRLAGPRAAAGGGHAQLYLARPLAAAVRLPWQRQPPAAAMTPGQVRAGFRRARQIAGTPARMAKPARPGPGRPHGSKNKKKAPAQPAGKHKFTPRTRRKHAAEKKHTG